MVKWQCRHRTLAFGAGKSTSWRCVQAGIWPPFSAGVSVWGICCSLQEDNLAREDGQGVPPEHTHWNCTPIPVAAARPNVCASPGLTACGGIATVARVTGEDDIAAGCVVCGLHQK